MLLQEGLVDIIPLSLSEQVAYLLADRASLLEKIPNQEDVKTADDPDVYKEDCGGNVVKVRESVLRLFCLTICQIKCIYLALLTIHIVSKSFTDNHYVNVYI